MRTSWIWTIAAALLSGAEAGAQQAGDTLLLAGWVHVRTPASGSSLHTELRSSLAAELLGIPESFDSPGVSFTAGGLDTLGLSLAHFLGDRVSIALNAGIPRRVEVRGEGVAMPPGLAGPLFRVDLGEPRFNPLGSARQWSPAVAVQYHFGTPASRARPFLGIGATYAWFTGEDLNDAFEQELNRRIGAPLALAAGKPGPTRATVDADPVWEPVLVSGVPVALDERWGLLATVAYVPFRTGARVELRAADGTLLALSEPRLESDAWIVGVLLSYRLAGGR